MPSKPTTITFAETQKHELESWFSDDPKIERDKRLREIIRYPLLKRQMGLDYLDTSNMLVADIGCGPYLGISSILNCKEAHRFDPLIGEYGKHYPQYNAHAIKAEEMNLIDFDLVVVTNALDHFESPNIFMRKLVLQMKPGSYFAHLHCEHNSYTHKHEAHAHSISPQYMHEFLDKDFECVWELTYEKDALRYGWHEYNGKVGQPAFSGLFRKVTGYKTS